MTGVVGHRTACGMGVAGQTVGRLITRGGGGNLWMGKRCWGHVGSRVDCTSDQTKSWVEDGGAKKTCPR